MGVKLSAHTPLVSSWCTFCIIFFQVIYLYMLLLQTYLQSTTVRLEEMRVKRRDSEQWMSHRLLPESLRERIRRYEQYKWQETRGVDEEHLLHNLPKDLCRDIKRHLCLALLMRVGHHLYIYCDIFQLWNFLFLRLLKM